METVMYELNLNYISVWEQYFVPDTFFHYSRAVAMLLEKKGLYETESDIIEKFKDDANVKAELENGKQGMEAVQAAYPNRYVSAERRAKRKEEAAFQNAWFDLRTDCIVTPQDCLYERFFAYKVRQTDILELDNLLDHALENYGDWKKFARFLKLILRKYGEMLMEAEQVETINEWIAEKEKEGSLTATEQIKVKSKVKRDRDDKMTLLNQEQTALLIYCLRETKIILKDELLTNKDAGLAFSILTGYSADTTRQNLNKSEISNTANRKNVEAVEKTLKEVLKFIEREVKPE